MLCARFFDEGSSPCGREATGLKWGIPLCDECSGFIWVMASSTPLRLLGQAVDRAGGEIYWDFGITYYVMLPNGNVKIGCVTDPERLAERWRQVSYNVGGRVTPLATEYGGKLKEAYRHAKLSAWRIPQAGEQFRPVPEVMQAASIGHVPMGTRGLQKYASWAPRADTFTRAG